MADAGLQIYNTSNVLQIDSTFRNYLLTAKGTASTTTAGSRFASWYAVEIPTGYVDSMCAVRSSVEFALFNGKDANGNITHRIYTTQPTTFEYWLFSGRPVGNANYGLEVYNAQGVRVFSAADGYLKPVTFGSLVITRGFDQAGWQDISSPGKNTALMFTSYNVMLDGNTVAVPGGPPQSVGVFKIASGYTTGSGARYHSAVLHSDAVFRGVTDRGVISFFLVDVDNI